MKKLSKKEQAEKEIAMLCNSPVPSFHFEVKEKLVRRGLTRKKASKRRATSS